MEIIITIKDISLIIGIWVAIYGIDSWRREHAGKRQIELAEETLGLFYEARDAISYIRFPATIENVPSDIELRDKETENEFKARIDANVVFCRYNEYRELFNKIHSMRYRFMAQIAEGNTKQFEDLRSIINEIFISAKMLAKLWPRNYFKNEIQWQNYRKHVEKHESIFWDSMKEDDPINKKVEKAIEEMENICKNIIAGKGTIFHILNKPFFRKR
ncbi:MAG: hypothetical protein ACOYVJ_07830 [Nitrospirota bacterium]